MKKSKIILSVLTPVAAVAAVSGAVAATLTLSSCSKNKKLVPTVKNYKVELKKGNRSSLFVENNNADRPTILPAVPPTTAGNEQEVDANFNKNPLTNIFDSIKNKINKIVKDDINDVILEFLSCMEQEKGSTEIELLEKDDNRGKDVITNVRINPNANFTIQQFLKDRKLPLLVDVLVEKEIEKNGKEVEIRENVKDVELNLYVEFAGKSEVLDIVQRVENKKPGNNSNGLEADYEDIMELLVGERKSKNPFDFDFDDIFEKRDSSIDEIGLLKYMSNFNDLTNSNGKMFGYTFDVKQFWDSLSTKANVKQRKITNANQELVFWAPSTSLCTLFVPEMGKTNAQLNTTVNTIKTKYSTFKSLEDKLNTFNNNQNMEQIPTFLKEIGIELPTGYTIKTSKVKTKSYNTVKKVELEVEDKFGNDIDFEFYSNWWK